MSGRSRFSEREAFAIGARLGVDWTNVDLDEFLLGLNLELEHGLRDPETDVTGDDPQLTAKIVLAHLRQIGDYYTRLTAMERTALQEQRRELVTSGRGFAGDPDC